MTELLTALIVIVAAFSAGVTVGAFFILDGIKKTNDEMNLNSDYDGQ